MMVTMTAKLVVKLSNRTTTVKLMTTKSTALYLTEPPKTPTQPNSTLNTTSNL